jgi:hypothetical protein
MTSSRTNGSDPARCVKRIVHIINNKLFQLIFLSSEQEYRKVSFSSDPAQNLIADSSHQSKVSTKAMGRLLPDGSRFVAHRLRLKNISTSGTGFVLGVVLVASIAHGI